MKSLICPKKHRPPSKQGDVGAIIRHGFYTTRWGKRRRYQCQACGKTFSEVPRQISSMKWVEGRYRGSFDRAVRSEPLARRGAMSYGFSMIVVGVNGWWGAEDEAERPVEDGYRGQEIGGRGQAPDGGSERFPDEQTHLDRRGKIAAGRANGKWSLGAVKKVDLSRLREDDL